MKAVGKKGFSEEGIIVVHAMKRAKRGFRPEWDFQIFVRVFPPVFFRHAGQLWLYLFPRLIWKPIPSVLIAEIVQYKIFTF